ncbi:MAG: hypothetical protein ACRDGG_11545, partial [Anaerolineae bacterium]
MIKPGLSRAAFFVLAWLGALLAGTVAVQLALQAERFTRIAEGLASLLLCAVIVLAGAGVGRWLIGERGETAERVALSIGIGLGAFSAATLALGLIGALRAEAGWALLAIAIVLFLPSIRAWLSELVSLPRALVVPRGLSRWAARYCL